jgi:hypothetical protein
MKRRARHYAIETLLLPTHEARVQVITDEMARMKATPEFQVANAVQQAAALRPTREALATERARILADVGGYVPAALAKWQANNPHAVQRRAAVENPARAVATFELVRRAGPSEAPKIAELLEDAADGYGARLAARQFRFEDVEEGVRLNETILKAGTSTSPALLRDLLLTKAAYAHTVLVADPDHPERALEVVNDAYCVTLGDGTVKSFTDRELDVLLGEED